MRRTGWVLVAALLAGCGGTSGSGGAERGDEVRPSAAPSPDPSGASSRTPAPGTGSPTPGPDAPVPTASRSAAGLLRVSGVVERSPEDRCTTLATPGRTWVLTGTAAGLAAGDRVTVRGRPDPDATTTCQRGPVLVVVEVERD